ncbi:MAG: ATPase, T2SS/T4P/T4SS family [Pseudomonadota bacterium]
MANGDRKNKLLGELLVQDGLISRDQLRIALTDQEKSGEQLGRILVTLGFISESVLRDVLGEALGQESIELAVVVPDTAALQLVPKELARRYSLVPISYDYDAQLLTIAMADTYNLMALDRLKAQLGNRVEIKPVLAGEVEVEDAIDQFYGYELTVDGILHEIETGEVDYASLAAESNEYSQPLVRLVDAILSDAVKRGASDIHFEPEDGFLRVRYRIDGVLRQIRSLHKNFWSAIAVRLKVMAGMNIAETRAPQDGRISLGIGGHQIDFRVSSMATNHGENIVLRILDRDKGIMRVDELGLPEDTLTNLNLMMARPEGLILVTGPTGSGKTTTLYSMLGHLNSESVNIMTLEDPVEYPMPMIRQSSVNESINLDFASGIRTMMRQDPDIILVGEIRDEETAEMAFRAAMTGHQVYSTLHTNSAVGAIPRLLDIGVLPDVLAGNIIGILAQRLVRRLCEYCKEPYTPSDVERKIIDPERSSDFVLQQAVGCARCDYQGYRGRIALMEVLRINQGIDDMIFKRATSYAILQVALESGFKPLSEDGLRRVRDGSTSLEEVSRVVDLTDRV